MFKTKTHIVYGLVCLLLLFLYVPMAWKLIVFLFQNPSMLTSLSLGIAGYIIFYVFLKLVTRKEMMWSTFEHELTHALICLITFTPVRSFQAANTADDNSRLGYVVHEKTGPARSILIGLSPYVIPTYTFFLMLIMPLIHQEAIPVFQVLLGFSFGYHLLSTWRETGAHQTDLQRQGLIFSYFFIVATNLVVIPFVIVAGTVDLKSALEYLAAGAENIYIFRNLFVILSGG